MIQLRLRLPKYLVLKIIHGYKAQLLKDSCIQGNICGFKQGFTDSKTDSRIQIRIRGFKDGFMDSKADSTDSLSDSTDS